MTITARALNWLRETTERFPRPFDRQLIGRRNLVGAEIGVWKGRHAASLLRTLDIQTLYLVDPYKPYNEVTDRKMVARAKAIAQERLGDTRCHWIFKESTESDLDDLDFVYQDDDHSYLAVKAGSEYYLPRIKPGGILGGHDYWPRNPSVMQAVNEFAAAHDLELHLEAPDWWIQL